MPGLVHFDASAMQGLLARLGVRRTWLSILRTSLHERTDLAYIFRSEEFRGAEILDEDLIRGLSIGEISVLYEYSRAFEDPEARRINGQFYTPDDVAAFMAAFSVRFPKGRWLDPCSGIGNLSWHLAAAQEDSERFLLDHLVLVDKDDLALLVARTLLTSAFQRDYPDLFHLIEPNFIQLDFLSVADRGQDLFSLTPQSLEAIPEHDFVIVNPPYLAIRQCDTRFETAEAKDLYAYFMENVIKSSAGFVSVTPQSFTNARKFRSLRSLLLRNFSNLTILCFDNIPGNIFSGIKFGSRNSNTANSTRAAITVALPGEGSPRITSLTRWRTGERSRLFEEVEDFACSVDLGIDYFPKVSIVFQGLFNSLRDSPNLSTMCQKGVTEYPLYVPSAPRYFIPALKSPANRASQRVIFFRNEQDRNRAYLLINSSVMYWWWRVRDGGMTLSEQTLMSLPVPEFSVDCKLVAELEQSEALNKVYKVNAGVAQENVKHPQDLIMRVNMLVEPKYAHRLLLTHENSEFAQSDFVSQSDRSEQ